MESSPAPGRPFDPSKPFDGLVLCCTNIEADLRTEIAQRTVDLGGIHKYDLTPDVTHLIVGDYDTAKYRHVARERPDIKPMAAGWVDAISELWREDVEFDFAALEETWRLKTFETGGGNPKSSDEAQRERTRLTCCLTGFEDNETRTMIESKVKSNGGEYIGDLSRRVTHLIVCKPEGKKYVAARKWGIRTVSIEWLHDSLERGMILHEECYDPTLPAAERGKGAWIRRDIRRGGSLGKRLRDGTSAPPADDGRRKLRKTASMKLTNRRDNLWGDILVNQSSTDLSKPATTITTLTASDVRPNSVPPTDNPNTSTIENQQLPQPSDQIQADHGVFSSCRFYVHGFPKKKQEIVQHHISSHEGHISQSIEDAASSTHHEPLDRRYLIVPQSSQPDSHPELPEGMHIVTEFYIERCVHNKTLFNPNEHVLGQPFPQFPIDGFAELLICTAGFMNEQLNQVQKAVIQLGARYSERLNSQCSLLVCPSLANVRKQKLNFSVSSNVPVVEADWLWQCITTGCFAPWDKFLFKEIPQNDVANRGIRQSKKDKIARSKSEPVPRKEPNPDSTTSAMKHGIDTTAFDDDLPVQNGTTVQEQETSESNYETAPTVQAKDTNIESTTASAPLSEKTPNALNKSPSPQKPDSAPRKLKRFPTGGEIGDSESGDDSDTPGRIDKQINSANDDEKEQRLQAERTKAAERQEMSRRLNSLMSRDEAAQDGDGMKPQSVSRQQRRRREILGRAASNVSTASSASAESQTHMSSSKSNPRRTESMASRLDSVKTHTSGLGLLDEMMTEHGDGDQIMANGDSPPRATQLEYDNSEAKKHRAAVVDRMMADSKKDDLKGHRQSQEKANSTNLKDDLAPNGTTQKASTKRVMRRR
ncbi:BRCT domain-containing protein [Hypoxylon trugodes]|uniref:BRCT domain-containing protein n=1 Tax=Hypoxylon trugodes TaxID=326681 RepID=UPI0021973D95|nr:BRCT domain-containing protein [Hypoxylon trugodes]KAI1393131.1 BRCT domain-containing protein [Hypoxylon trugodes]